MRGKHPIRRILLHLHQWMQQWCTTFALRVDPVALGGTHVFQWQIWQAHAIPEVRNVDPEIPCLLSSRGSSQSLPLRWNIELPIWLASAPYSDWLSRDDYNHYQLLLSSFIIIVLMFIIFLFLFLFPLMINRSYHLYNYFSHAFHPSHPVGMTFLWTPHSSPGLKDILDLWLEVVQGSRNILRTFEPRMDCTIIKRS